MKTGELLALLERHYIKPGAPLPGGIFLPEVGWNGGRVGVGGCDALYVGFTSTSGRILVGHELKVSRADWLKELNSPGKADGWADECHAWCLVVAEAQIVKPGELPAGWGLMVPGPSKTRMTVVTAPVRKPVSHAPSWHACRSLMARQDTLRAQALDGVRRTAREEASADLPQRIREGVEREMRGLPNVERLRDKLAKIERALGGEVDVEDRRWDRHNQIKLRDLAALGTAAKHWGSLRRALDDLTNDYVLNGMRKNLERTQAAIDELRAIRDQQQASTTTEDGNHAHDAADATAEEASTVAATAAAENPFAGPAHRAQRPGRE